LRIGIAGGGAYVSVLLKMSQPIVATISLVMIISFHAKFHLTFEVSVVNFDSLYSLLALVVAMELLHSKVVGYRALVIGRKEVVGCLPFNTMNLSNWEGSEDLSYDGKNVDVRAGHQFPIMFPYHFKVLVVSCTCKPWAFGCPIFHCSFVPYIFL
jgi:hypothetical protein